MELTTQAAIVSALLALLVLLVGLARRDRRRRSVEATPQPAADVETVNPVEAPVDAVDEEPSADEPVTSELVADELVTEEAEEPVHEEHVDEVPVLDAEALVEQPAAEEPAATDAAEEPVIEAVARRGGWRAARRRRRRAAAKAELDAALAPYEVTWPTLDEIAADSAAAAADSSGEHAIDAPADAAEQLADEEPDGTESPEQAELRDLRARVRILEGTLLTQLTEASTGLAVVPAPGGEPTEAYLRQISLVVRGLAEHTDEAENPHRTLARVAAAVERLGVPNGMDRPVLPLPSDPPPHPRATGPWRPSHRREVHELEAPAGASQDDVVAFPGAVGTLVEELVNVYSHGEVQVSPEVAELAPQVEAQPMTQPQPMTEPMAQPITESMPEPMPEPTQAMELPEPDQAPPTYDAAEVVLPVPPPAQSQPQSTRRRFRR